ncbi:MAG TPA: archease [bacterium]|nr:archease [bacterium]
MEKLYRPIDHTGDLGVEIEAPDFEELVRRASLALTDTLVEADLVRGNRTLHWTVEAGTEEGLLVGQLQEILFRMDAEGLVFGDFKIERLSPRSLSCRAAGEPLDRERHGFKTEIKAVTYHGLKIGERGGKKTARLIFDV